MGWFPGWPRAGEQDQVAGVSGSVLLRDRMRENQISQLSM